MKKILIAFFCVALAAPLFADGTNQVTDERSRISYAIGVNIGDSLKRSEIDADPDIIAKAIKDVMAGTPTMTDMQARQTLQTFQQELRAKITAKNLAEGEAFLATNKLTPGVKEMSVTLPNGKSDELQYMVLTTGDGPVPKATDKVKVNYRGMLLNGTEFDSSYKRGQPATFPVTGVIHGWTAALEAMPVGSKWKLFVPADLAYGESGRPGIPPNSVLIFEVELLDIEAPAPPPAPPAPAPPLTSDIIKVPSAADLKNGAKIETIKAEDVSKYIQTNQPPAK